MSLTQLVLPIKTVDYYHMKLHKTWYKHYNSNHSYNQQIPKSIPIKLNTDSFKTFLPKVYV